MKRDHFFFLITWLLVTASCIDHSAPALHAKKTPKTPANKRPHVVSHSDRTDDYIKLTLLTTNDLHGQLDTLPARRDRHSPQEIFRSGPQLHRGGALALGATIAHQRAANPQGILLLDAGDFMQGSLLSNHFEGQPIRELFALFGYDAVVIGNHEFDFGACGVPDPPASQNTDPHGALKNWIKHSRFPVLAANIEYAVDRASLRWPGLFPSILITKKGVTIGLIGVTTPRTKETTMPTLVRELRFTDMAQAVRREAAVLRRKGATIIIVLAHAGGDCNGPPPRACRGELFEDLLDKLKPGAVDVVVAGHSHQPIARWYRKTMVTEAFSKGLALGHLELVVQRRTGQLDRKRSRIHQPLRICQDVLRRTNDCADDLRPTDTIIPNPSITAYRATTQRVATLLDHYRAKIQQIEEEVLAHSARPLRHGPQPNSEVGALFVQALHQAIPKADFAIFNAGGIRADLPEGPISYGQLFRAFPFDNRVAIVQLTGQEVRRLIEILLAHAHGFPSVWGLKLTIACLPDLTLRSLRDEKNKPLSPRRLYRVILNDFLLAGGDGLGPLFNPLPPHRKHILVERLVREEIAAYLRRTTAPLNSAKNPLVPSKSLPITIIDGPCWTTP